VALDRSNWLVSAFLILGVLLPTACVLWFMNDAATSQATAARQSVTEAYRNELPLLRDRVEAYWKTRAAGLASKPGVVIPVDFAHAVKSGLADSVIYLGANGSPLYPSQTTVFPREAKPPEDLLAAQAQIRSLVQGDYNDPTSKDKALRMIQEQFVSGPLAGSTDSLGRLVAADEQLLALHLLPRSSRRFLSTLQHFVALLNDYEHVSMPAAQRLFLMDEVRALDPNSEFPTLEAERLAAQYLEADSAPKGTWKLTSAYGRIVALYRTSTMVAATDALLDRPLQRRSVRFEMLPPGLAGTGESIEAGPLLPGWRISFALLDTKLLDEAARARRAVYLWAGFLAIGAIAVMGVFVGNISRRQMRLARLKTDLVAAVSHEIKTPLASMRLLVDSLLEDTYLDPLKTLDYLRLIAGENDRLTRLVENFLTFSRIEHNRQRFEFAPVKPDGVIHSAAQVMRERFQTSACQFEVEAPPDLPLLYADQDALIMVLLNLIDNAYKYTLADKHISVRAHQTAGELVVEVADNGIGIAPRDQKRIFRRFYQVDRRLARETGGCGLGLSIVEFVVQAHGGSVRVKSRPGAGSTFIVRLPFGVEHREATA
jgi:signal transduction histidine kinase